MCMSVHSGYVSLAQKVYFPSTFISFCFLKHLHIAGCQFFVCILFIPCPIPFICISCRDPSLVNIVLSTYISQNE